MEALEGSRRVSLELSKNKCDLLAQDSFLRVLFRQLKCIAPHNSFAKLYLEHLGHRVGSRRPVELISVAQFLASPRNYNTLIAGTIQIDPDVFVYLSKEDVKKAIESLWQELFDDRMVDDDDQPAQSISQVESDPFAIEYAMSTSQHRECQTFIQFEIEQLESNLFMGPMLKRIQTNVLQIKPSSILNEQLFSSCGFFINKTKNQMSDAPIESLIGLKTYFKHGQ